MSAIASSRAHLLATLEIPEMADDLARGDAAVDRSQGGSGAREGRTAAAPNRRTTSRTFPFTRLSAVSEKKPGLIAQQEIDDAHSKDLVSEAQISAAKSALAAANQQVDVNMRTCRRSRP